MTEVHSSIADKVSKAAATAVLDQNKKGSRKGTSIYGASMLSREVMVPFKNIGKDLRPTLERIIRSKYEGKCGPEGFIRPDSVRILTHTAGVVKAGNVVFTVGFECLVCNPVAGMHIRCTVRNVTKAGIRAEIEDGVSPVIVYVARDHHYMNPTMANLEEDDTITVRVIGQRFELNDKYISVIGQLIENKDRRKLPPKQKPLLKIVE